MLRQGAHPRSSFVEPSSLPRSPERVRVRQAVAEVAAFVARLVMLPLVAVGGALAGVMFVLLLPICGIASIAEGIALGAWRQVRSFPHRPAPHREPLD
jgi:hypothetical protein